MKKMLSVSSLLLLLFPAFAQTLSDTDRLHKNVNVIYDFNTPGIPYRIYQYKNGGERKNVQKVWYGKGVNLDLIINPYLYDVHVTSRQALDEAPDDNAAAKTFQENLQASKKQIDTVKQELEKTPKNATATGERISLDTKLKDVIPELAKEANFKEDIEKNAAFVNSLMESNIATLIERKDDYSTELKPVITNIESAYINLISKNIPEQNRMDYIHARKNFINEIQVFDDKLSGLDNYLQTCNSAMLNVLTDGISPDIILTQVDQLLQSNISYTLDQFLLYAASNKNFFKHSLDSSFQVMSEKYNLLVETNDTLTFRQAKLFAFDSALFNKYDSAYKKINLANVDVVAKSLAHVLNNLKLNSNVFLHRYHVEFAQQDSVIFNVRVTKSARYDSLITLYGIKPKFVDTSFVFPVPVKGCFKLNFSVGMSFLYNNLRKSDFYFDPNMGNLESDGDTVFIRQGKQTNRYQPVVSAFAHAYLKFGGWFTPAITVGISTNPTDLSNSSFMLGGSIIFGHNSRFIATYGLAGTSMDYLKSKYKTDTPYLKKDLSGVAETDLVEKTFRAGMFFGFSYNLSKK